MSGWVCMCVWQYLWIVTTMLSYEGAYILGFVKFDLKILETENLFLITFNMRFE